jgi:hypothetical protein
MTNFKLSSLARAVAICAGALVFAGTAGAADKGDKATYDQAKASAKAAYDTDKKACDSLNGQRQGHLRRRGEGQARARRRDRRSRLQEHAEGARACGARDRRGELQRRQGTLRRQGRQRQGRLRQGSQGRHDARQADAKAAQKGTEARMDANKDKRDADYKVAAEKCDTMSGDAKDSCVKAAKARYGSDLRGRALSSHPERSEGSPRGAGSFAFGSG